MGADQTLEEQQQVPHFRVSRVEVEFVYLLSALRGVYSWGGGGSPRLLAEHIGPEDASFKFIARAYVVLSRGWVDSIARQCPPVGPSVRNHLEVCCWSCLGPGDQANSQDWAPHFHTHLACPGHPVALNVTIHRGRSVAKSRPPRPGLLRDDKCDWCF